MKRLIPLIALVVILVGLPVSVVSDTGASLTDNYITHNEITSSRTDRITILGNWMSA